MSDEIQTEATAVEETEAVETVEVETVEAVEPVSVEEAVEATGEEFTYNGERYYYAPEELPELQTMADAIADTGLQVTYFRDEWPEGAGGTIQPLTKRIEKADGSGVKTTDLFGAVIWPSYTLEAIMAHAEGAAKVRDILNTHQGQAVLNPLRRQDFADLSALDLSSVPKSLNDFIEGMAGERGLYKAFNEAAKVVLANMKKTSAAFKSVTVPQIREYCSSKAYATQFNAALEEKGFWLKCIDALEEKARELGHTSEIFETWRSTRDAAESASLDAIDVEAFFS